MEGRAEKRERDNIIFSGRRGRERELLGPSGMGREGKEEASKLVIPLGREGKLGIGREERGGAADPPQEGKEEGEGSANPKWKASKDLLKESREEKR
jgi:hypothetical protein